MQIAGLSLPSLIRTSITMKHHARTLPGHPVPELRTLVLHLPREKVFNNALKTAGNLSRWKVIHSDPDQGCIRAEARTRSGLTDDVGIIIRGDKTNGVRVDATSKSRIGMSDLGQNTRNITKFLAALRKNLGNRQD